MISVFVSNYLTIPVKFKSNINGTILQQSHGRTRDSDSWTNEEFCFRILCEADQVNHYTTRRFRCLCPWGRDSDVNYVLSKLLWYKANIMCKMSLNTF